MFFWVARMAMLCGYVEPSTLPFESIWLHPMVRDAQGRKMSKSLGNVVDPTHVIDGVPLDTLVGQLQGSNLPASEIKLAVKNLRKEYPDGIPVRPRVCKGAFVC